MPKLPGMKALPWMRVMWALQIIAAGFQELAPHERKQAREIASRIYRDRRLSPKDRQNLMKLARTAGRGAVRGVRKGGVTGLRGKRR
jgi:hypothetical protein